MYGKSSCGHKSIENLACMDDKVYDISYTWKLTNICNYQSSELKSYEIWIWPIFVWVQAENIGLFVNYVVNYSAKMWQKK